MSPPTLAPEVICVEVLLFSVLRERTGAAHLSLQMPRGATAGELLDALIRRYAAVAPYRDVIRLAVNEEYAPPDVVLAHGDEVALITPVSGG